MSSEYASVDIVRGKKAPTLTRGRVYMGAALTLGVTFNPKNGLPLFRPHTWPDISILHREGLLSAEALARIEALLMHELTLACEGESQGRPRSPGGERASAPRRARARVR